jgi:hypothetical protein
MRNTTGETFALKKIPDWDQKFKKQIGMNKK